MGTLDKGKVILRSIPDDESEALLVSLLAKVYTNTAPDQLIAVVKQKKPAVLAQDVSPDYGQRLVEYWAQSGADIYYLADRQKAETKKPAVASDREIGKTPGITPTNKPRNLFRKIRISSMCLLLLCTMGFGYFKLYGQAPTVIRIRNLYQALVSSADEKVFRNYYSSDYPGIYKAVYQPVPSIDNTLPEDLLTTYADQVKVRPDIRFLLAFEEMLSRWEVISDMEPGTFYIDDLTYSNSEVTFNILRGKKVIVQVTLPNPAGFNQFIEVSTDILTTLDDKHLRYQQYSGTDLAKDPRIIKAEQQLSAVDPRFLLMGLATLDQVYRDEGLHPLILSETARAYGMLALLTSPEIKSYADPLAVQGLVFLAISKYLAPEHDVAMAEAVLSSAMGYKRHADIIIKGQTLYADDVSFAALGAYLRREVEILEYLADEDSGSISQALVYYLRARLYREMGLGNEAATAAREFYARYPMYPSINEYVRSAPLEHGQVLTVLYPMDILELMGGDVQQGFLERNLSLLAKLGSLTGFAPSELISLERFESLLANWQPFGVNGPEFLVNSKTAKQVIRALYLEAIYLRFDMLLNRLFLPDKAVVFLRSFGQGPETNPFVLYMQGKALETSGRTLVAQAKYRAILDHPSSAGELVTAAYSRTPFTEKYKLLPKVLSKLDGRPWSKFQLGWIFHSKLYDLDRAVLFYEQALSLDPYEEGFYINLAMAKGSPEFLLAAVNRYPESILVKEAAENYLEFLGDNHSLKKALGFMEAAADMAPSDVSVVLLRGRLLQKLGRYFDAIEIYNSWLDKYSDRTLQTVKIKVKRAEILIELGRYKSALSSLEGSERSHMASALTTAARCYEGMGNYYLAEEFFDKALERYPKATHVVLSAAGYYWRRGDYKRAAVLLATCRDQNADDNYWYTKEFVNAFESRSGDEILKAMRLILANGGNAGEARQVALALDRKGRYREAIKLMDETIAIGDGQIMNAALEYRIIRKIKGRDEARKFLLSRVDHGDIMVTAMYLHKAGSYQAVLDLIGDPDSYDGGRDYREFLWLTSLHAWLATGMAEKEWEQLFLSHYSTGNNSSHYFALGKYLLGKISQSEVLKLINTAKKRCEISFYLALSERFKGNFDLATQWYQICLLTQLEKNGEYHWASGDLETWFTLGASNRNKYQAVDVDNMEKMTMNLSEYSGLSTPRLLL